MVGWLIGVAETKFLFSKFRCFMDTFSFIVHLLKNELEMLERETPRYRINSYLLFQYVYLHLSEYCYLPI